MKIVNKIIFLSFLKTDAFNRYLLLVLLVSILPSKAVAVAGDVINNIATVNFTSQGNTVFLESSPTGNAQPGVGNGAPTSIIEDRLINFSVISTDAAPIEVAALESGVFLTFTVTNNGNAPQDFLLTAVNTAPSPFAGVVDSLDLVSPMQVFVEDETNAGFLLAEDTAVFVDELAIGASATVYVVATIPDAVIGDAAAVALVAQVAEAGAVGQGVVISNDDNGFTSPAGIYSNGATNVPAGTANSIANTSALETVFNDPSGLTVEDVDSNAVQDILANGQHSDVGIFLVKTVGSASVSLDKTVTVIDTQNGTDPHPGSTLRYQIDVVVTGNVGVNNLVITDPVPANTTFTTGSIKINGIAQTDISDAPNDYSEFNGSNIVVDLSLGGTFLVLPTSPNLITFDVTID